MTLGPSSAQRNPTAIAQSYTAKTATYLKISSPGLLLGNTDPNNLPLTVVRPDDATHRRRDRSEWRIQRVGNSGLNPYLQLHGAELPGKEATGTATVTFPTPSNLMVNVVDAAAFKPLAAPPAPLR